VGTAHHRDENDRAWKVAAADIFANGCNLDRKDSHIKQDLEHLPPGAPTHDIVRKERRILEIVGESQAVLEAKA
jgi:hypothetical protein